MNPEEHFPVAGGIPKCGNIPGLRAQLGKTRKEPLHDWVNMGPDIRNCGEAGFLERQIQACARCGTDRHAA